MRCKYSVEAYFGKISSVSQLKNNSFRNLNLFHNLNLTLISRYLFQIRINESEQGNRVT